MSEHSVRFIESAMTSGMNSRLLLPIDDFRSSSTASTSEVRFPKIEVFYLFLCVCYIPYDLDNLLFEVNLSKDSPSNRASVSFRVFLTEIKLSPFFACCTKSVTSLIIFHLRLL